MAGENLKNLQASASDAVAKLGLEGVRAEVVLVLDVSRSMFPIYRAKIVQELVPQFCALALNFDDDGVIPAYAFGDACRHLKDLRAADFGGWVDREVIRTGSDYQTHCRYAPVIHEVCRYYFPEDWDRPALKETVGRLFKKEQVVYPMLSAPRAYPIYGMFVTGGECEDEEETADAIRRASRLPIFWQFIGLSTPGRLTPFRFLKKLDKLDNMHVDNCGFFEPGDVRNTTALYRGLLNELPAYLRLPAVSMMLDSVNGLETRGERPDLVDEDAELDKLTKMPEQAEEPSVIIDAMLDDEPEPDPNRDIAALKQKFAGIEWSEGTHGGAGGGAVRAAAPMKKAPEEPVESSFSRRRLKPSEVAELQSGGGRAAPKEDSKSRVQQRLASLKSKLSDLQGEPEPEPEYEPEPEPVRARPQPPLRQPSNPPSAPQARPQPPSRPQPPARPAPEPPPATNKIEALRARLASLGEDSATVAATGDEVDQEVVHPPARPQPPSRPQPPARPQPPPRRPSK